jgi:hypothetical protein
MSLPSVTDKPVNIADALERLKSATELVVNKGSDKVDVEAKPTMSLKKPITKSTLTGILAKYYEGDMSQAITMNNYIMANREEVVKETLQRKLNKVSTDSNA